MAGAVGRKATRKTQLKKALWGSVTSLILCMMMLVGTTFAWFTSTASTGVNTVQAGQLEVQMSYAHEKNPSDGTDRAWGEVKPETNLFKTISDGTTENPSDDWQPGTAKYVQLKVQNSGNLDLKYRLGISIPEETGSINNEGNAFKLSDYLNVAVLDGAQYFNTAEEAIKAAESRTVAEQGENSSGSTLEVLQEPVTLSKGCVLTGKLSSKSATDIAVQADASQQPEKTNEKIVTFIVYMPKDATSNEANYKAGADAPEIKLGVTLLAAQTASESDSMGNNYDQDASFTANTPEQLQNALLDGGTIVLGSDMTIQGITISKNTVIDLAGRTLTLDPKEPLENLQTGSTGSEQATNTQSPDAEENISAAITIQKNVSLSFTGEGTICIPKTLKTNTCLVLVANEDETFVAKKITSAADWKQWLERVIDNKDNKYEIKEESSNDDATSETYVYTILKRETN